MTDNLEITILANLLRNDDYMRKVIPFIRKSYFNNEARDTFERVVDYVQKFNALPSQNALRIELEEVGADTSILHDVFTIDVTSDADWIMDKTESWCQSRAIEIAIAQSYNIILGKDTKRSKGSIPGLLQDALGVTFDASIGHDYFKDAEERFKMLREQVDKLPFDLEVFNKITGGGFEPGSLNVIMASCVSPITKVKIKLNDEDPFVAIIAEVPTFIENGYEVRVEGPDGFKLVEEYLELGRYEEYVMTTANGIQLSCNKDHLVMTTTGWQSAQTIEMLGEMHVMTIAGWSKTTVHKTGEEIPIVDVRIEGESKKYYTDGIVSHNTGVGKSLIMSHMAAAALSMGHDVLYITLEMAEHKIAQRIDANLLGINLNDFDDHEIEALTHKVGGLQSKTNGDLIIKQYPAGAAGVNHFRALLQDLKLKKNFVPKIIFVDYLNLMSSTRLRAGASTYEMVKSIAEELRGLGVEFWLPIVSATQTNRDGYNNSDIDLANTSESFGLPATSDFFLAVMQTEELAAQGQYLCKQLKNRYKDMNEKLRFMIGVDKPTMRLYELDSAQGVLAEVENEFKSENDKRSFEEFDVS